MLTLHASQLDQVNGEASAESHAHVGHRRVAIKIRLAVLVAVAALVLTGCRSGVVDYVVDGDTVDVNGVRVRIVGIDTPERGQCGYKEAKDRVIQLVLNQQVTVVSVGQGTDRYGRELGYIDRGRLDVGRTLIAEGLAVARYDSLDGYPRHPRQDDYRALDRLQQSICK